MRSFFHSALARRLSSLHAIVAVTLLIASAHICTHTPLSAPPSACPVVDAAEGEHSACEAGGTASQVCCLCICKTPGSAIVSVPLEEPLLSGWLVIDAGRLGEAFFTDSLDRPPRFFL